VSLSLGELQAIALKATRGAGFSWSLAEEAAYAVYWLEARGIAGAHSLADYLSWVDVNARIEPSLDLINGEPLSDILRCPIHLGCYVLDSSMCKSLVSFNVKQPLLLVPFLARAAQADLLDFQCNADYHLVSEVGIDKLKLERLSLDKATVSWSIAATGQFDSDCTTRAVVDKNTMGILLSFASRTYAPATQASRLTGAGAGTTDND
jgi:hypothetical protein